MIAELSTALFETTLASSVAILVVLCLRRVLLARLGAGAAYAAWALVPVAWLAVLMPAPVLPAVAMLSLPGRTGALRTIATPATGTLAWHEAAIAVWALGALAMLALLWAQQRRFQRRLAGHTANADGLRIARTSTGLPAVVGVLRPRIVLPADFATRYDEVERELILCHERIHIRRGDLQANALAAALRALYWFNPLLHYAVQRFRRDQELACDERVIARHPNQRRRYADAMLKTQIVERRLPIACHWQASTPLKERIAMLKRHAPRPLRSLAGTSLAVLLCAAGGYTAWAAQPARMADPRPTARVDISSKNTHPPIYPLEAVQQGINGRVVLIVDVAADGNVDKLTVEKSEPAGVFDATVLEAAGEWKFQPASVDGKPVPGRVRVPVDFRVDDDKDDASASAQPPTTTLAPDAGPRVLSEVAPGYPAAAAGRNGKVVVAIDVDAAGQVVGAAVETAEPAGVFDQAALQAARKFRFAPAHRNGQSVASRISQTFYWDAYMTETPTPAGHDDDGRYRWFAIDTRHSRIRPQGTCDMVLPTAQAGIVACGKRPPDSL